MDFGHEFFHVQLLFRGDRLEGFPQAASDIGDAGEQVAADPRAEVEQFPDRSLFDWLGKNHAHPPRVPSPNKESRAGSGGVASQEGSPPRRDHLPGEPAPGLRGLEGDDVLHPCRAQRSVQVGKATDTGAVHQFLVNIALIGALVAGH